jgi:hypothetical protein
MGDVPPTMFCVRRRARVRPARRPSENRVDNSAEVWFRSSLEMTAGETPERAESPAIVRPSRLRSARSTEKSYIDRSWRSRARILEAAFIRVE